MKTLNSTYGRGVVVGCAFASLLLMASTLVYMSFEGGRNEVDMIVEGKELYEPLLSSAAANSDTGNQQSEEQILTRNSKPPTAVNVPVEVPVKVPESEHQAETFSGGLTSQEQKKQLLTVIVSSRGLLKRTSDRIRSTWGSESADYRIIVGSQGGEVDNTIPNVLGSSHPDYPSFPYLSFSELVGVIDLVSENFLEYYNWFLLAPTNTYVSVQSLGRLLQDINPNKVVYIGRPSNTTKDKGSFCEGGPGIVFSHMALYQMKGKLQQCVKDSKGGTGYRELGLCLSSKLDAKCQFNKNHTQAFLHDTHLWSKNPNLLWVKLMFRQMVTLYPIRDQVHMENIHSFNQEREISFTHKRASAIQRKLRNNSLCNDESGCRIIQIELFRSAISFNEFSKNCHYSKRGYVAEIRRKVEMWNTVTGHKGYDSWNISPQELVHGGLSKELKHATSVAVNVVTKERPDLNLHNVENIHMRYRGTVGREYILDMKFNSSKGEPKLVEKRVSLVLPHTEEMIVNLRPIHSQIDTQINFIVPLNGLNRKKTAKFQRNFYTLCVRKTENCRVVYIMFSSSSSDVNFMKTYLVRFKRRHPTFNAEYVVGSGKYEPAKAYNLGLSKLNSTDLAFIATIDLNVAQHFLTRCRTYSERGQKMYYPELFMYYNMPYVYRGKWHPRNYEYSRLHGRWATHAVMCIYKSDYTQLGGYETFKKWEVDPSLVQAVQAGGLEVIQAPDPGVSHWYTATHCDSNLPPDQFSRCLSTRSDNLADRLSLAGFLLSLEEKCGKQI